MRDYLIALLDELWREGEGFSGKRPFGNSGWDYEVYVGLVKAGAVDGKIDEYGYLEELDEEAGRRLILDAIKALGAQQ